MHEWFELYFSGRSLLSVDENFCGIKITHLLTLTIAEGLGSWSNEAEVILNIYLAQCDLCKQLFWLVWDKIALKIHSFIEIIWAFRTDDVCKLLRHWISSIGFNDNSRSSYTFFRPPIAFSFDLNHEFYESKARHQFVLNRFQIEFRWHISFLPQFMYDE